MAQAMWMMNNRQLQDQVSAKTESKSMLSKLLAEETSDRLVATRLFQRVLSREPTDREVQIAIDHVASVKDRGGAFEDLLWSLVNSAEFTTRP